MPLELERPARDKPYRLFCAFVKYGHKKFYNIGPGPQAPILVWVIFINLSINYGHESLRPFPDWVFLEIYYKNWRKKIKNLKCYI